MKRNKLLIIMLFFITTIWCYAQSETCKIRGDNGTFIAEVESYNYKTGKVTIVVRNSASRHVNINIKVVGYYEEFRRITVCSNLDDIFPPGKSTKTVSTNVLYSAGKSSLPSYIKGIVLSGADFDGYLDVQKPSTKDYLRALN